MASRFSCTVVPVSAVGLEDSLDIVLDNHVSRQALNPHVQVLNPAVPKPCTYRP